LKKIAEGGKAKQTSQTEIVAKGIGFKTPMFLLPLKQQ
jgi:hypothetical protein